MSEPKSPGVSSLAARLVAELGIIILGVLIALWADGWVSDRQDRSKEAARVLALRDNVVATQARLAEALENATWVKGELIAIARWADLDDFQEKKLETLLAGYLFGPRFTPEMNVYDDLENSGELALLSSDSLRQALARMSAALFAIGISQQDLLTVQQLNFDRFAVDNLALSRVSSRMVELEDLPLDPQPELPELRIIRNLALFKLDLMNNIETDYKTADVALQQVLEEIDAYLE